MDDLIRRQAVIEVIDAVFPVDPMKSEYAQGIACGAAKSRSVFYRTDEEENTLLRKECKSSKIVADYWNRRANDG